MAKNLTAQREKFVECLLSGMSDRQAYYEAYPNSRKWKENSVDNKACLLKKDAKVMQRLEEARAKVEAKTELTAERITDELRKLSTYNVMDAYDGNGVAIPIHQLPRDLAAAITKVDTYEDKEGNVSWRYTFASKDKALQLLSQIKGMLQPKEQVDTQPISVKIDYGAP